MFSIASRSDVQVRLVAQHAGRLHGIALMILREFLQAVEGFLIDKIALLDPALNAAARAHARETLLAVDDLHPLAILHVADFVVSSGDLVAKRSLRCRDISYFEHVM